VWSDKGCSVRPFLVRWIGSTRVYTGWRQCHDHDRLKHPYLWEFMSNGTIACKCRRYNNRCVIKLVGHTDDEVVQGAEADDAGDAQSS
jgi:hypothetical protein